MTTNPDLSLYDEGPPPACLARFNLAAHTLAPAITVPGKTAIEVITAPGAVAESWSFQEVEAAIRGSMTGLLDAGIRPGDRLLLRLGHSIDFPILHFAAIGIGALPIPTSSQLTADELAHVVNTVTPAAILGDGFDEIRCIPRDVFRAWRVLPPAAFADTRADDPAYIVFTSGTGGRPRAVVHAHRAGFARRMMWRDWYDLHENDRLLHAGAFNWTFTLGTGLTDPWAVGATALIYAGPADKGVWSALTRAHAPTLFAAAPGVFRQLLASGTVTHDAFSSLRHALSAGEAMPAHLRAAWQAASGKPVYEALGMSEVSTYTSESPHRAGLRPQRGRRIAVLGTDGPCPRGMAGDLAVAGSDPGLMLGYWRGQGQPFDLPLRGEWFVTGDRAEMAADGSLRHLGRADDLMNAQGYRVAPYEVEEVLCAHPDIAEAAVLSLPVRDGVEVIAAFLVTRPHAEVSENQLARHCAAHLARYKCPRIFEFLPALPRTATGKVLKRKLRAIDRPQERP